MIFQSLQFWVLLAGLLAFVARFFFPAFPLDEAQILAAALFLLGLLGVTPSVQRAFSNRSVTGLDLFHSKAFWTLLAGLVSFVIHYFAPEFPLDQAALLGIIIFVLGQFGIIPELWERGFWEDRG